MLHACLVLYLVLFVAVILNEGFNFLCLFAYTVTSSRKSALTLLKHIYLRYAETFPAQSYFWDRFLGEQIIHKRNTESVFFWWWENVFKSISLTNGDTMYMFSILGNCADRGLRLNTYSYFFSTFMYVFVLFFFIFDFFWIVNKYGQKWETSIWKEHCHFVLPHFLMLTKNLQTLQTL